MAENQKIVPCLWFDDEAEEAASFYIGIFKDGRVVNVVRYGEAGQDVHGKEPGSVMVVEFELRGQRFTALNGGPMFKFNEAISLQVGCDSQEEVDYYWDRLSEGGDVKAQQCGWLKDRFGLSWQVFPTAMFAILGGPDPAGARRAAEALFRMKKLDLDELRKAYEG